MNIPKMTIAAILCMTVLNMGGCQTGKSLRPLSDHLAGNSANAQMEFWHTMAMKKTVSNDEAFHGLLLYLYGKDRAGYYTARVNLLKSRRILSKSFDRPAGEALSRGTLAQTLVSILKIKGGVIMRLVGPQQRYAVRELQYVGIYPRSSPNQTFSGSQYVSIMGRVEDYTRAEPMNRPKAPLPPPPPPEASPEAQPQARRLGEADAA